MRKRAAFVSRRSPRGLERPFKNGVTGPSQAVDRASKAPGQKRTSDDRLTLKSRRNYVDRFSSAPDPLRTLATLAVRAEKPRLVSLGMRFIPPMRNFGRQTRCHTR